MSDSDFGYQVFPYACRDGVTVAWNAVVYDLTRWQDLPSGRRFRFVALIKPFPSQENATEAAIKVCQKHERARKRGLR